MKAYISAMLLASAATVSALPATTTTEIVDSMIEERDAYNTSIEARGDHPSGHVYLGTFKLDCRKYPESCNNICFAVECLPYFGKTGASTTQTWSPSQTDAHRKNSGAADWKCSEKGYQCDEWPAASLSGGGYGASLSCIKGTDNMGAGSKMGNWVGHNKKDAYEDDPSKNPSKKGDKDRDFDGKEGDTFDYDLYSINTSNSPMCAAWKKNLKGDALGKICKDTKKNQFQPKKSQNSYKQPDDYTIFGS